MKDTKGVQTLESMSQAVWYNRWTLNKFKEHLKGEILEVGCGIGNFTKSLREYGNVTAMDIDNNYINEVKKLINGKAGFGDIEAGKYFFGAKLFDTIVCINVLEHIKKDKQALKNLYKLLKENSYLILLVPSHPFLFCKIDKSIGHFRRYEKNNLTHKLKSIGFEIIYSRRVNFLGGIGWWFAGKILNDSSVKESKIRIFNLLAPLVLPLENIIEPPLGTSVLIIAKKGTSKL